MRTNPILAQPKATQKTWSVLLPGLALAGLGLLAARPAQAQYAFTSFDVGATGATNTNVFGINDSGQIAGTYVGSDGINHGFFGTTSAQTTVDGPAALSSTFQPFTEINKINNAGAYAGDFEAAGATGTDAPEGFIGAGGTAVATNLNNSQALGINNAGDTVGGVLSGTGTSNRSYLQSHTGTLTVFDVTGYATSQAAAINDSGVIVGTAAVSTNSGPTVSYIRSAGATPAFNFLGISGAFDVFAKGINNAGTVVGGFDTIAGGNETGFVFSGGTVSTVVFPSAIFTEVDGINSFGQLVGTYIDSTGAQHGFLAAPVPEASTTVSLGLLLSLGLGGMMFAAKRKKTQSAV